MKGCLICTTLAVSALGHARPATRAEFYSACAQFERALDKSLRLRTTPTLQAPTTKEPVTRSEVIRHFDRLFAKYRPRFRVVPRPAFMDNKALRTGVPATEQEAALRLVKWGFVPPVGPLVVGPGSGLTPQEAGDAIAFFFCQAAVLTTKADPRFTPQIMPG